MAYILSDGLWLDHLRLLVPNLVLFVRVVSIHLVLKYHLLNRMSVSGWSFIITKDHTLLLVLSHDDIIDHLILAI